MGKTTVIYRDKDSGKVETTKVDGGFISAMQEMDALREEGHEPVGHRESGR